MDERHPYIGIGPDGKLQLVLSREILPPVGHRLCKGGEKFPAACYDLYSEPITEEAIVSAIRACSAWLSGEEHHGSAPVFGDTQKPTRKKRA
jgi:hypothetical protein